MKIFFYIFIFFSVTCCSQVIENSKYNTTPQGLCGWDTDLWLPDTIYLTQGNTITIYNDNVAYIPAFYVGTVSFDWVSSIGIETSTYLKIKGITTGNYAIKLYCKNSIGQKIDSVNSIVKIEPKIALGAKTILYIGNSLTSGGCASFNPIVDDSLNITVTTIGTQGVAPNKHEGYGGYTISTFLGASSPFYISGAINIPQWLTDNSFATPDIIRIELGINDCYSLTSAATSLTNIKLFVDKCLEVSGTKIIVVFNTTASNTIYGWMTNYSNTKNYEAYIKLMRQYSKLCYTAFANGAYNSSVYISYDGIVINRNTGYPKVGGYHSNGLHPQAGILEYINGSLNIINHIYQ